MKRLMGWVAIAGTSWALLACGSGRNGVEVRVEPAEAEMVPLTQLDLTAYVRGTLDRRVDWTIQTLDGFDVANAGTISPNGTYTAPKFVPPDSLNLIRVRATSIVDPEQYSEAVIRIVPAPLVPKAGPSDGGTYIKITGSFSLSDVPDVYFDDIPSPSVSYETEVLIIAETPAHEMGEVDFTLKWPDGREVTYPKAFRYSAGSFQFSGGSLVRPCSLYANQHVDANIIGRIGASECSNSEVIVSCDQDYELSVVSNETGVNEIQKFAYPGGYYVYTNDLQAHDVNGDGYNDIVIQGYNSLTTYINQGMADDTDCSTWQGFAAPQYTSFNGSAYYQFGFGELDGDPTYIDVAFGAYDYTGGSYRVFIVPGVDGGFDGSNPNIIDTTAYYSLYVTVADVDGDGDDDIVSGSSGLTGVYDYTSNGVEVLSNDGAGNFTQTGSLNIHTQAMNGYSWPQGVRAADINGDGAAEIYYLLSDPVGLLELSAPAGVPVLNTAYQTNLRGGYRSLRIGNFNGPGKLDVAYRSDYDYANSLYEQNLTVLFGDDQGGMATTLLPVGQTKKYAMPTYAYDIELADLDGDTVPEMTVSDSYAYDNFMVIMQGNKVQGQEYELAFGPDFLPLTGVPTTLNLIGVGATQSPAALISIDQSTIAVVDLMVGAQQATTGQSAVGSELIGMTTLAGPGETPGSVVSHALPVHLNNDGYDDLLVVEEGVLLGPTGAIWLSLGGANLGEINPALRQSFTTPQKVVPPTVESTGGTITDAYAADLDADGYMDLIYGTQYGAPENPQAQVGIYWGAAPPAARIDDPDAFNMFYFNEETIFMTGYAPERLMLDDMDGDTDQDIVLVDERNNKVSILENTGLKDRDQMFDYTQPHSYGVGESPRDIIIEDVDNDGFKDMIVLAKILIGNDTWTEVDVLINRGGMVFGHVQSGQPEFYRVPGNPYQMAYADVDSDGLKDIIVSSINPAALVILRNASEGEFLDGEVFVAGARPQGMAFGDFNEDGLLDLAVADYERQGLRFLTNLSF